MKHHHPAARTRRAHLAMVSLLALSTTAAAQAEPAVGRTQLSVGDLPVTLVYPTLQAPCRVESGPFVLLGAPDAEPQPGRHRLVVMSHGTGGSAQSDHALAATLARTGFVVAQPLHGGDNHIDASRAGPEAWRTRPQEVSRVIDALAADPRWQPLLQLDKVGVHGMSAGGVTALSLAGAQWSVLDLLRHCVPNADVDLGFCFNGAPDAAAQASRRASYDRVRGVPEAHLPAELKVLHGGLTPNAAAGLAEVRPDTRIAAVTVAVPVAAIFSADSLARIRVPVGVVSAGRDTLLLPAFHSGRVLQHCKSCVVLADLPGAGHFDLLAPWPQAVARSVAAMQPRGGLPEPGFDAKTRDAAFDAIARFFSQQLRS